MTQTLTQNGSPLVRHKAGWACPALDVIELPDEFRIDLDLPGASKDDIELHVDRGVLHVAARVPSTETEGRRYHLREHQPRELTRRIRLADSIDVGSITAEVQRGTLTVHLPKHPAVRARRIEVR